MVDTAMAVRDILHMPEDNIGLRNTAAAWKSKRVADGPLFWRFARLFAGNPRQLLPLARAEYRRRVAIPRERRRPTERVAPPVNLSINLTRRCNLRCAMCLQHRRDRDSVSELSWYDPRRELSVTEWIGILDQVAGFRPTLYVTGGEPLLYAGFQDFIRAAQQRGLFAHVATNGTLLARHAAAIVDHSPAMVTVSVDGPAAVHDTIRGQRGLFDQTADGIRALVAARRRGRRPAPIVGLNFTISRANVAAIGEMVPLAIGLEADFLQFQHTIFDAPDHVRQHNRCFSPEFAANQGIHLVAPSIPDGEFYPSEITDEHVPAIVSALETARRQASGRIRLSVLPNLPASMIRRYYGNVEYPLGGHCDTLWKTLRILPDGTVSPCLHVVAGNLRDQAVDEIWNGSTMRNFRKLLAERLLPGCARCCSRSFRRE